MPSGVVDIPIGMVIVGANRRALRNVTELAHSISELGLLNPITVTQDFHLVAGYHRLEACRYLGWVSIPAITVSLSDLDARLAEIDENLIRNDLTILERSESFRERKEIYEAKYPIATHGGDRRSDNAISKRNDFVLVPSFAEDTAAKTNTTPRTIQQDVQIATNIAEDVRDAIRETPIADSKVDLLALARLAEDAQRQAAAKVVLGEAETVREAVGKIKEEERRADLLEQKEAIEQGRLTLPAGVFEVISVDPPWPYGTEYDPTGRRAANPYPEMSLEELAALQLPAADDCVLWLWTTHQFMRHAFPLLDAWGFREVSILTWEKDRMGLGVWLRSQSEFCIMAVKGKPSVLLTNQTTVLHGQMREHSRKPEEFYALVNSLCIGRKLDYFSREKRPGWECFGNDTERFGD